VTLKKATKESLHLVGQKAIQLAVLAQKFPVPVAFIITAAAFDEFLTTTQIKKQAKEILEQLEDNETKIQEASDTIRMLILNAPFPEELREEVHDAYYALNIDEIHSLNDLMETGEEPIVVLRPSSIHYEETNAHESILGIQGMQQVENTILQVWASFYSPEAIALMIKNKKAEQTEQKEMQFAIIIQRMIDSQASGIIHTSYKMNKEEVLIFGCKGLGTVLNSGLISPDKYFITKKSLNIASIEMGKQPFMLERDFDTNTIAKVYMQEEYSKKQKITDRHIGELTLLGNTIEQLFGKPQEVDFAIYKETISILGSRDAEWYKESLEKAAQLQNTAPQWKGPTPEEIEQKEKEISSSITQELEQDTLVVNALNGTAQHVLGASLEAVQASYPENSTVIQADSSNDPNDINAVILGIDFSAMLNEIAQTATAEIASSSAVSATIVPQEGAVVQTTSVILEKQVPTVITEAVGESKEVAEEEAKEEEIITEPVQTIQQKELSAFEKTAGDLIIHCFKEVKEKIPKEQWATSPELRHLAVLAQNFSQKNVPPTAAQVKFALDAMEKVR